MLRIVSVSFLLFLVCIKAFAYPSNEAVLSDKATISVITCSAGTELYASFGHTAIRVSDPPRGYDMIYNYGSFDFNTTNFYLKFAKGDLLYYLSVVPYHTFLYAYEQENRSIEEQVLNLNRDEKQKIFILLQQHLKPESKYYRYQFFEDNCTTRVYRILVEALDGSMLTDTTYIKKDESFRALFSAYVNERPWVKLGMNLGLGIQTDKVASFAERMFLPFELEAALDHSYKHNNKDNPPLVVEKRKLYEADITKERNSSGATISPLLLFYLAAFIVAFISFKYRTSGKLRYLDVLIFGSTGFLGLILLCLWIFSYHTPTHHNLNLLWLSPLNFLLLIKPGKAVGIKKFYIKCYLLILVLLALSNAVWGFLVAEFYPLFLIIAIRLLALYISADEPGIAFRLENHQKETADVN